MPLTRCKCHLRDCYYYHAVAEKPDLCDCAHPDKPHYMHQPCPLYKKDWEGRDKDLQEDVIDRMKSKRKL